MRALVDTSVVLDLLLQREPWFTDEAAFWEAIAASRLPGYLSASMVTDIFYITRRAVGLSAAHQAVATCLRIFGVVAVNRRILRAAMRLPGSDFEDNVQIACAVAARLDAIVTRDPTGFTASPVPALSPAEALARI